MYIVIDGQVDIVVDFENNKIEDRELPDIAIDLGICGKGLIKRVTDFKIKAGLGVDQQLMKEIEKVMAAKLTQMVTNVHKRN